MRNLSRLNTALNVVMPKAYYQVIRRIAIAEDRSYSHLVRCALRAYLDTMYPAEYATLRRERAGVSEEEGAE